MCLAVLAAVDQAVLPIVRRAEARRYESAVHVRFENSDLFLLGPLTEYLREHPVGRKPRVAFFGSSVVWGYQVEAHEAIPSAFQRLAPQVRVINFGVNGFRNGEAYLISKAVIDAVEVCYLFRSDDDGPVNPLLPQLIDVSLEDAARFGLTRPSPFQERSDRLASRWRLARYSYRLQAAWFGTSTRQFLYLQVGRVAKRLLGPPPMTAADPPTASPELVGLEAPSGNRDVSDQETARLSSRYPLLWDYAQLLASHRKRGVIIDFSDLDASAQMTEGDRRLFNTVFHPYVVAAKLIVPPSWRLHDRRHLTPAGSRGVAEVLYRHTAELMGLR